VLNKVLLGGVSLDKDAIKRTGKGKGKGKRRGKRGRKRVKTKRICAPILGMSTVERQSAFSENILFPSSGNRGFCL
jgi:hypothetical protein